MRSLRTGGFAAVAAIVAASAAWAGDVPASKNTWTSFKPGSWVTLKTSIKTIPYVPEQCGEGERRMTLVSVNDEEYVVRSEKKSGDTWTDLEETTHSRKPEADDEGKETKKAAPAQAVGEEKFFVEGTAYVCKKTKTVSDGVTEITWTHKQHGVLKKETSGPGDQKSTELVTALAKKVTISGKKVTCHEEKTVSIGEGLETTIVILTSDDVPSGKVRVDIRGTGQGVTVISVIEVTGFEVK